MYNTFINFLRIKLFRYKSSIYFKLIALMQYYIPLNTIDRCFYKFEYVLNRH